MRPADLPDSTSETVDCDTPAARATSTLVTRGSPGLMCAVWHPRRPDRAAAQLDLVEETIVLGGRDLERAAPARLGGADRRARLRARGVPALLGGAVAERAGARAPRRVRALHGARTLELGCGLGAAEPGRGARGRAGAGDRLVAAGDRAARAQRGAQRARDRGRARGLGRAGRAGRARAVGPRARRRPALRAPQRGAAAAAAAAPARAGVRAVARRSRAARQPGRSSRRRRRPSRSISSARPAAAAGRRAPAAPAGLPDPARARPGVATFSARVATPPVRRRRCGTPPSKSSASPSWSAWISPSRSTSRPPRAT